MSQLAALVSPITIACVSAGTAGEPERVFQLGCGAACEARQACSKLIRQFSTRMVMNTLRRPKQQLAINVPEVWKGGVSSWAFQVKV